MQRGKGIIYRRQTVCSHIAIKVYLSNGHTLHHITSHHKQKLFISLRSESGIELEMDDVVEVMVLSDGGPSWPGLGGPP